MPWHQARAARHQHWRGWCQRHSGAWGRALAWGWGRMPPKQIISMQHRVGFESLAYQHEGLRFIFYAKVLVCMESCPRWHQENYELLPKTISCTFPAPHWPSAGVKRATVLLFESLLPVRLRSASQRVSLRSCADFYQHRTWFFRGFLNERRYVLRSTFVSAFVSERQLLFFGEKV